MLRVWGHVYVQLGEFIQATRAGFPEGALSEEDAKSLTFRLNMMLKICQENHLQTSEGLLLRRLHDLPQTGREFAILADALVSELSKELFCYVPSHLAKYYDSPEVVSDRARGCFPKSAAELVEAGTALAAGLSTACVFHSMRAVEIGVRALAKDLGVTFPDKPLELAELQPILNQIDAKVRALAQTSKSMQRDKDQQFYSTVAAQFRYFKDGWRIRFAHAREGATESEAKRVLDHVCDFFDSLSERLSE